MAQYPEPAIGRRKIAKLEPAARKCVQTEAGKHSGGRDADVGAGNLHLASPKGMSGR